MQKGKGNKRANMDDGDRKHHGKMGRKKREENEKEGEKKLNNSELYLPQAQIKVSLSINEITKFK